MRSTCHTSHGEALVISCGVAELADGEADSLVAAADEDLFEQKHGRRPSQFVR